MPLWLTHIMPKHKNFVLDAFKQIFFISYKKSESKASYKEFWNGAIYINQITCKTLWQSACDIWWIVQTVVCSNW